MAPADRDQFVADRYEQVQHAREEAGCLDYAFSLDAYDAGRVRLIERWIDSASLDAHIAALQAEGGPKPTVALTGREFVVVEGDPQPGRM
ncbi:MAG: antibiotic biosynthesis monooxygenase [Frankiaceae bacterium]|nr:antibiotic biosynthesis monooxygenase [Frankiaceae bacterium]MBV9871934.1 antibiotic biosynthesis monooxygenase [Frankiaceae bacterium]